MLAISSLQFWQPSMLWQELNSSNYLSKVLCQNSDSSQPIEIQEFGGKTEEKWLALTLCFIFSRILAYNSQPPPHFQSLLDGIMMLSNCFLSFVSTNVKDSILSKTSVASLYHVQVLNSSILYEATSFYWATLRRFFLMKYF